jgi:hypothetical protein
MEWKSIFEIHEILGRNKVHPRSIIYNFILSMKCNSFIIIFLHEKSIIFKVNWIVLLFLIIHMFI